MSKINIRLSYKELQIIKHALGQYTLRKSITDKEREEENRLKMKFANEVADFKETNNIFKYDDWVKDTIEGVVFKVEKNWGKHLLWDTYIDSGDVSLTENCRFATKEEIENELRRRSNTA